MIKSTVETFHSWLRRSLPKPRPKNTPYSIMLPPELLRRSLERERARADRTGDAFSMITLTPRFQEEREKMIDYLATYFYKRLRITDEVGWLDDDRMAVLLSFTRADGAWKVADDVVASVPEHLAPPLCAVFTYPCYTNGPDGAGSGGGAVNDFAPSHSAASNGAVGDSAMGDAAMGDAATIASNTIRENSYPLEAFFLQPVPWWKGALDVSVAALALILLAPILLIVALAIKLTSPGPVFFKQKRSGRGGLPFVMYKFRTMTVDAEARKAALRQHSEQDGPAFKLRHDPRVTRLGRFLRKTSLDELPQLWNVIRGEMSLVGPRPLPCDETEGCMAWQRRRLDVKPGLTCIWQIYGRSRVTFDEWCRMDLQYVQKQSLVFDLSLLLRTVPAVVLRKGAC